MGIAVPLIMGAATLGAGALGYKGQQDTNAANAAQAQMNRDFQERMRATQYQTAVDDMRKAGLNPALAYQQGGAGTPSGATAVMGNSATSAASAAQTAASIAATAAQAKKTDAEARQIGIESLARLDEIQSNIALTKQTTAQGAQRFPFDLDTARTIAAIRAMDYRTAATNADWLEQSFAPRLEQLRAEILSTITSAREGAARSSLLELERPGAENIARSEQTWYGKYMRPYVNDAQAVLDMVSNFVPGGKLGKLRAPLPQTTETTELTARSKGSTIKTTKQTRR